MVLRLRQHNTGYTADGFYRSDDPTNSVKALKEGGCHPDRPQSNQAHLTVRAKFRRRTTRRLGGVWKQRK